MRELGLTDLEQVDGGIALGGVTSFSTPTAQQTPNMYGLPGAGPLDFGLGSIGSLLHDPAVGQVVNQFLQNPAIQEAINELREASPQLAGIINQFTHPNQGGNLTLPFGLNGNGLNPGAFAPPAFPQFAPPPFAPPVFSFPQAGPLAGPLGATTAGPVTGSLTVGPNETSYSYQANGPNGGYSYSYSYSGSSSGGPPSPPGAPAGLVAAGTAPV